MYICIYIHIYMYVYTCICLYMYICICLWTICYRFTRWGYDSVRMVIIRPQFWGPFGPQGGIGNLMMTYTFKAGRKPSEGVGAPAEQRHLHLRRLRRRRRSQGSSSWTPEASSCFRLALSLNVAHECRDYAESLNGLL